MATTTFLKFKKKNYNEIGEKISKTIFPGIPGWGNYMFLNKTFNRKYTIKYNLSYNIFRMPLPIFGMFFATV